MARPQIIANGGSPGVKASVAASSTVTFTLDSLIGVNAVSWSVMTTDETSEPGDYTLTTSGSKGQTMSLSALGEGTAGIVKVQTNGGLVRGRPDPLATTNTIKFFVPTAEGFEVGCAGETYESDPDYGSTAILNAPIRNLSAFTSSLYEADLKRAYASATSNVALTGNPSPMDSVTVPDGEVVLLVGQTATEDNGLWTVNHGGAWTRPANFATTAAVQGATIAVLKGAVRTGFIYQNTNTDDPVIGTDALTFARMPDRFDRADIAQASSTPGAGNIARFDGGQGLQADAFKSNGTNPALSGLLRAVKNTVAVAFRDDANGADLQALSMDATDVLRIGSALVEQIHLSVKNAGEIRLLNNAVAFFRHALSGMIFGRSATMSLTQEASASSAGTAATIEAQKGSTGNRGGDLNLRSGQGGGVGDSPGNLEIDTWNNGTVAGEVRFNAGSFGQFLNIAYNNSTGIIGINGSASRLNLACSEVTFGPFFVGFFGSGGGYGSGEKVIFIGNANAAPSADPSGGGYLYVDSGALKYRGSAGTITTIAPA